MAVRSIKPPTIIGDRMHQPHVRYAGTQPLPLLAAICLTLLMPCLAVAAARPQRVPVAGTKVTLIPPAAFLPAERFPGFVSESTGAAITITDLPVAYQAVSTGMTAESLAAKGIELLQKQQVKVEQSPALLLHVRQVGAGKPFLKWIVVLGNAQESVLVTATFPEAQAAKLSRALKTAVLSTRWHAATQVDPLASLPFTIAAAPAMKFAQKLGYAALYTKDGTLPGRPTRDPLFVVAPSSSQGAVIQDKQAFSVQRLMQTASVTEITVQQTEALTVQELTGFTVVGRGKDKDLGHRVMIYQVTLFGPTDYVIMQGLTSQEDAATYEPIFRTMAQSYRPR